MQAAFLMLLSSRYILFCRGRPRQSLKVSPGEPGQACASPSVLREKQGDSVSKRMPLRKEAERGERPAGSWQARKGSRTAVSPDAPTLEAPASAGHAASANAERAGLGTEICTHTSLVGLTILCTRDCFPF